MGLFDWLSGDSEPETEDDEEEGSGIFWLAGTGRYDFDIVGESHYQDVLEEVCDGRTSEGAQHDTLAMLAPEPDNRHDRNAIKVMMFIDDDSYTVGYLSRDLAVPYRQQMARLGRRYGIGACRARVVGGWTDHRGDGHFGVKLDLAWPLRAGEAPRDLS